MPSALGTCGEISKSSIFTLCRMPVSLACSSALVAFSSLGVGEGSTVTSALLWLGFRCEVVTMLASCGDVEFEAGNLSAEGAFGVGLTVCVACCWLLVSGGGYFLDPPLFSTIDGGEFSVRFGSAAADPLTRPVIHDFMCFLPSA